MNTLAVAEHSGVQVSGRSLENLLGKAQQASFNESRKMRRHLPRTSFHVTDGK